MHHKHDLFVSDIIGMNAINATESVSLEVPIIYCYFVIDLQSFDDDMILLFPLLRQNLIHICFRSIQSHSMKLLDGSWYRQRAVDVKA